MNMKIAVVVSIVFLALPSNAWHLAGTIQYPGLRSFVGYGKVKVELISGGMFDTSCGDTIAHENGAFVIDCPAPFNVLEIKNLKIFHRFASGVCKVQIFNGIQLNDGQTFMIIDNNSVDTCKSSCPDEIY
ncbi:unnamed protein product [Bursaphelenchus xylophilus]|uniref:(pine wood nematode) hypothetical protein n=1 Tax=Bursaphelenchus xylophilus TaxID=6326 RepID=A0A1I7RQR0_BURXY|nr:unnamed protein product [Bursaphelenchus xylophilus]CAG9104975.1 unnamed protein product [Bursaphelenchus xylophilus]